jgi:hypothetical protein
MPANRFGNILFSPYVLLLIEGRVLLSLLMPFRQ